MDLSQVMPKFPDVTQFAIPFFILAMIVELAWLKLSGARNKAGFETRDTLTSLLMGTGNVVAGMIFGIVSYTALVWLWQFRFFDLGLHWWVFVGAFLLDDFRYYWYHRIAHRVRWVWAEHVNHHSSQHYNLSTALRQSWTATFTGMFILRIPLVLIGFHPLLIVFVGGINLVYQFWIHTETIGKLWRPIEFIFNTPSHHRVHHATNPRYLDRNYAGVFIIWDRLFGTFEPETDAEEIRYGIVRNLGTHNPLTICLHEWWGIIKDVRSARSLRDALGYWLGPPGWSPDGSRDTAATLKARWMEEQGLTPPRKPDAQPPVAAE